MYINSIFWLLCYLLFKIWSNLGSEHQCVDCDSGSSCIWLHCSCHKALREKHCWNPICSHCTILNPLSEEYHSFNKIINPWAERLKWWICIILPKFRNFFIKKSRKHVLKLKTHNNCSFNSFLQITQAFLHHLYKLVKPLDLLHSENV